MAFIFEGLIGCSITLAFFYSLLAVHTAYRLKWLQTHSSSGLNTRKLFVMTLLLTALLRAMSFASMVLLDLEQVDYQINSKPDEHLISNDDTSNTRQFFEKSTLVLFDFPDFSVMSAYMLLFIIWAEAYLKSRRHWLSSLRFRRVWLLSYFVFNIFLYSTQVGLYSLLFLPSVDEYVELNLIYLTLSTLSFLLPIVWALGFLYLTIMFSGFPFSTLMAKIRLRYLTHLSALWTLSRLVWGFMALTTVLQGWLTEAKKSKLFYSIMLVVVFTVAELLPIWYSLQPHIIQSLAEERLPELTTTSIHTHVHHGLERIKSEDGIMESDNFDVDHLTHLLVASNSLSARNSTPHVVRNPMYNHANHVSTNGESRDAESVERSEESKHEDEDLERMMSSSFGERSSFFTADSERERQQQQTGFLGGLWGIWS